MSPCVYSAYTLLIQAYTAAVFQHNTVALKALADVISVRVCWCVFLFFAH